jgi:hypothetical protein
MWLKVEQKQKLQERLEKKQGANDMSMKQLAIKLNSLGYVCVGADIVNIDNIENANIDLGCTPLGQYVNTLESKRTTRKRKRIACKKV